MNGLEIKIDLKSKGFTFTLVGKAIGASGASVSAVANRNASSARIALAIAKAIDKPVSKVFPEKSYTDKTQEQIIEELRQKLAS